MPDGSALPNTENISVAYAAIAFEIAKAAMEFGQKGPQTPEDFAARFSKIYLDTWKTVIERKESSIK